jgi:hypothetical protein
MGPRVQQGLQLLQAGRYAEAGELFGQVADRARDNGNHIRSARMALQAEQAFVQANNADQAMIRARQAVRQFLAAGRPGRAVQVLRQSTVVFRSHRWNAQADALEQDAQAQLAERGLSLANVPMEVALQPRGMLPSVCPRCGGPLKDVEWIDPMSAECPYCESVVRAEPR